MRNNRQSITARFTAAWRAAESKRPREGRICHDPVAKYFLSTAAVITGRIRPLLKFVLWLADRFAPGSLGEVAFRTKYIDEYLKECIGDGIRQLVILGAGYDSRAYRFPELKENNVRVFEVDHPATQRLKMKKLAKVPYSLPRNVVYVPMDFNKENFDTRLIESGYDKDLKTLFIWEGVTTYLTAETVDKTLGFVVENSGADSSIIFNYTLKSVVDRTCELEGAEKWRRTLERMGEPPTFGIDEETIKEFLGERGFYDVNNVTMDSLKDQYIKSNNRKIGTSPWVRIAHAKVNPKT